ncbi:predicted protein [Naegleria gruberi]|uniref:Predicted protein n=1 Tax=Naegleria gruberi TaxID=5762 RepID=D2V1J0_NAEGR|nr:uncharacterized protein NAEGRDRAFT_45900 [Naegleria gruberi]EFC49172.1 predicted protein [Naegleria gruberi]|eukprot:XP_002681916.1 predicted protein [Naegleria gruberi strain NEG-M]
MTNNQNQRSYSSSSNNNNNNKNSGNNRRQNQQQQHNNQSKKRKQDQTISNNSNNDHHRKRKSSPEDMDSKIARILGVNNNNQNQQQFASASSSSTTSHSTGRNKSKQNNRITSQKSNNTIASASSSGNALPGFYFDSKANRYFPIPKNGLECSLLVGNSEDRMVELETHKMSQLKIRKKIEVPSTSSRTIQSNVVKYQSSTLLNHDRKNQFYTHIKSRMIHPSDNRLYNKHVVNRMENFKLLNNLSNIDEWEQNDEILKYQDVQSNIQITSCSLVNRNQQVVNRNIMTSIHNDILCIGEFKLQKEDNYQDIIHLSFSGKPIYSISIKKNNRGSHLHFIVTPKQTSNLFIIRFSSYDEPIHEKFALSKNKTVFSQSIHPNNRWCAIGLNKGGIIIDLNSLISKSAPNIKASTIAFISNQYSDILITYWNPFIVEFGELMYARRDGGIYISQLQQSNSNNSNKSNNRNPTFSQQEICSLQYGTENFIGQILSLDEDRFLVRSICKNELGYSIYIHMFDKRKLSLNSSPFHSCLVSYDFEEKHQQLFNLSTITEEVNVKMFIHNSRFLICGDSKGWLRVWDIYKGGKPISTKKLQDCTCSELVFFSPSCSLEPASHSSSLGSDGYLLMPMVHHVRNGGYFSSTSSTCVAIPLH